MKFIRRFIQTHRQSQEGQGLVEYALILLLVAVAVVFVVALLQPTILNTFRAFIEREPVAPPSLGPLGGEFTPLPGTATSTPTNTPTPTSTHTPTASHTPTPSLTATATITPTASSTAIPSDTPTSSPVASDTPTLTPTNTPLPPTPTQTHTPTPTPTNTPIPSPTPTPTNTPIPPDWLYFSPDGSVTLGGVSLNEEDIGRYDRNNDIYEIYLDLSDVGVTKNVDALAILPSGDIVISFSPNGGTSVPGVGTVQDEDLVVFSPTSTGTTTAGTFAMLFDGSDVNLSATAEDIDAVDFLSDGTMIISTSGDYDVGVTGKDEDLIRFTPVSWGTNTSGSWSIYFDGSDVDLDDNNDEEIWGVSVQSNGDIWLTTLGSFSVTGISGQGVDIFVCQPGTLGATTTCTFSGVLAFDGSASGFSSSSINGFDYP